MQTTSASGLRSQYPEYDVQPPEELIDRILTLKLINQAVITPNGDTYDREGIEKWISQISPTCPVTRLPLTINDLRPNREFQRRVDAWKEKHRITEQKVASVAEKQLVSPQPPPAPMAPLVKAKPIPPAPQPAQDPKNTLIRDLGEACRGNLETVFKKWTDDEKQMFATILINIHGFDRCDPMIVFLPWVAEQHPERRNRDVMQLLCLTDLSLAEVNEAIEHMKPTTPFFEPAGVKL